MISVAFPRMFNSRQTILTDNHEATVQAIKLTLLSEKMELTCDPYFGTNLKRFLYEKGNTVLKDILIDDIYVALTTFVPQIKINREDIEIKVDRTKVYCIINCINLLNYTIDLLNINLLQFSEDVQ